MGESNRNAKSYARFGASEYLHVDVSAMMISHNLENFDVILIPGLYGEFSRASLSGRLAGWDWRPRPA